MSQEHWSDASVMQYLRLQELSLKRKAEKFPSLAPSEEAWYCQHLDLTLPASRTLKQEIASCFKPSHLCGITFLWQP